MPTGTVELILNYGDPLVHLEPDGERRMPRFYVSGQRTQAVLPFVEGRLGLLIVSLYPWALRELFPACVSQTDCYADLEQLVPRLHLQRFTEAFEAADSEATRTRAAYDFLTDLVTVEAQQRVPVARAAVRRLVRDAGRTPVSQLADEFGFTGRHFARRFGAQVGLSPKRFSRVMRFQLALAHCRRGSPNLAQIASTCGYTDQAHLSHEMLEFSGRTPRKVVERARARSADALNDDGSSIFECVYL